MNGSKAWETRRRKTRSQVGVNLRRPWVLSSGVDTLHVHTTARLQPAALAALLELKAEAVKARDAGAPLPSITLAVLGLTCAPHGTGKGSILLQNEELTLIVNPDAPDKLPTVLCELRSVWLWSAGYLAAVAHAHRAVQELVNDVTGDLEVSRLDVCVDFVGWVPTPELRTRFSCRAQRRSELHEEWRRVGGRTKVVKAFRTAAAGGDETARAVLERLLTEDELTTGAHFQGKSFTGFSWGAGVVVARLYDKTRELKKTGKGWFFKIWQQQSTPTTRPLWRPGLPVWRLEFQLRRELLKDAKASDGPVLAKGRVVLDGKQWVKPPQVFARWSTAAPLLADLWGYLSREWLSLRLPRSAGQRVRFDPVWKELQRAATFDGSTPHAAVWRRKLEDEHLRTLGQQGGYMARGLSETWALAGNDVPDTLDQEAAIQQWVKEVRSYALAHRGDVVDRALERWDTLNYRRRLYGEAHAAS